MPGVVNPRHYGPLVAELDRNSVDRVYADYWIAYRLAFETDERIIAAQSSMARRNLRVRDGRVVASSQGWSRNWSYNRAVDASEPRSARLHARGPGRARGSAAALRARLSADGRRPVCRLPAAGTSASVTGARRRSGSAPRSAALPSRLVAVEPDSRQDPFRSLELDSAETLAWQARQNEAGRRRASRMGADSTTLRAAVAPHLARVAVTAPVRRGDHWFRVDSGPLVVADTPIGPGRVLVDPGRRLARLVLPLAARHPRRLRGLVRRRRAERAPRDRDGDRRGAAGPDPVHLQRHRRVAPRRDRVRRQRRHRARLRARRQGAARPPARPGRAVAARADRGARAVLRLPAGLGRRALARRDHERGRAARRLDPGAPGRQLAAVPARRRGHVQRRLRRRRLRRGLHGGGAAGAARQDPDRDGGANARPGRS